MFRSGSNEFQESSGPPPQEGAGQPSRISRRGFLKLGVGAAATAVVGGLGVAVARGPEAGYVETERGEVDKVLEDLTEVQLPPEQLAKLKEHVVKNLEILKTEQFPKDSIRLDKLQVVAGKGGNPNPEILVTGSLSGISEGSNPPQVGGAFKLYFEKAQKPTPQLEPAKPSPDQFALAIPERDEGGLLFGRRLQTEAELNIFMGENAGDVRPPAYIDNRWTGEQVGDIATMQKRFEDTAGKVKELLNLGDAVVVPYDNFDGVVAYGVPRTGDGVLIHSKGENHTARIDGRTVSLSITEGWVTDPGVWRSAFKRKGLNFASGGLYYGGMGLDGSNKVKVTPANISQGKLLEFAIGTVNSRENKAYWQRKPFEREEAPAAEYIRGLASSRGVNSPVSPVASVGR